MTSDGFCYPLPTGEWAIEGFVFALKGNDGEFAITPDRLLGPPVRPLAYNLISLRVAFSGEGVHSERFHGELVSLDGSASVLSRLVTDIERLRSGEGDCLIFPSAQAVEFHPSCFQCRVARDRYSTTGWSMLCRCATPTWWKGDFPPSPGEHEHGRFAGTVSVLMALDADSLEVVWSDVVSFLLWLDREASSDVSSPEGG